jgi:hypothetical protein
MRESLIDYIIIAVNQDGIAVIVYFPVESKNPLSLFLWL